MRCAELTDFSGWPKKVIGACAVLFDPCHQQPMRECDVSATLLPEVAKIYSDTRWRRCANTFSFTYKIR